MTLTIRGLSKAYDEKPVLRDINLTVNEGEFVALLGESGCGKTTLLSAIAGLIGIDAGTIALDEQLWSSPGRSVAPERRKIGMVFQDGALWPHMTVFQNVAFGLRARRMKNREQERRVEEVLSLVRMSAFEGRYPHQLSGGQRQRVSIARALAPDPSLLLMDEPLSSLDAKLRQQMRWDLLRIVQSAGATTIFVTHDQSEALSMADRVVLLRDGRIEQEGSPTDLYRQPKSSFAASFLGGANLLPGRILTTVDATHTVDCGPLAVQARGPASDGEVSVMIRPSDILLDATSAGQGTNVKATIVQRAFQGTWWQYLAKGAVSDLPLFEVWSTAERSLGSEVELWLGADVCRTVVGTLNGHGSRQSTREHALRDSLGSGVSEGP